VYWALVNIYQPLSILSELDTIINHLIDTAKELGLSKDVISWKMKKTELDDIKRRMKKNSEQQGG
jgi:hypothetical protein